MLQTIATAVLASSPERVIEIGPGKGALTALLLESGAEVTAIELDRGMIATLERRFAGQPRLRLIAADVLDIDLGSFGPATIAGNLPYYITSPILERITRARQQVAEAVLLIQLEVARRVMAKPGTRDYGYLSVMTQCHSAAELITKVPAGAFHPPPKVESAVVKLTLRSDVADQSGFLAFCALAFQHKRKTLRNNLRGSYGEAWIDARPEAGLRAEQLSLEELRVLFASRP